ncbi:DUF1624 domain-containing protein, partial [Saccharopolyspora karakumensis]
MTAVAPERTSPRVRRATGKPGRLVGVDVARFVAVFGMFCIHFGVPFAGGWPEVWLAQFFSGRSTALFTFLAGVSLALMTGRSTPPAGRALRDASRRVAVRAAVLLVLGLALAKATEATGFLLTVIIPFYGLYFLLAVPFLRLRARGLIIAASVSAALGPQLSFVLRGWGAADTPMSGLVSLVNSVDPGHLIAEEGIFDLLLFGFYPAASYLPLVLAGLAVGRMDLTSTRVRLRVGLAGVVMSLIGYQVSFQLVPVGPPSPVEGTIPVGHPEWLLAANAHSGTTFELLGSGGIALVILAVCLELADRTERALTPLAKAGSMALTLYAAHALALAWQIVTGGWPLSGVPENLAHLASMGPALPLDDPNMPWFPRDGQQPTGLVAFVNTFMPEVFLVFTFTFTYTWLHFFRRGPLEALVSDIVRWST